MSKTAAYRVWATMLARCRNPNNAAWALYGGRGIVVCERWLSFESFRADMGDRPSPTHSLDRIDPNGNYEPGNVRWSTPTEQANNRRSNHLVTFSGETRTIADWARHLGVPHGALNGRFFKGWGAARALTQPFRAPRYRRSAQ